MDPHKLAFTNKLMETVPGKAKAGGTGQPVNAEPWVISATSKSLAIAFFVDLESAYADRKGVQPFLPVTMPWMARLELGGVSFLRRPMRWLQVLLERCWRRWLR